VGRRPFALVAAGVVMLVAGLACRDKPGAARDAGADGVKSDGPSAFTLDIVVTGCASYDADKRLCAGQPPLALSFAAVGSPQLTQFLWKFGDGTPNSTERAPLHTYAHPDTYVVFLTGSAGYPGSVPASPLTIAVQPVAAGAPCDIDDQCADSLTCVCAPGSGCAAAFIRGICSTPCDSTPCATGATCADVTLGGPTDAGPAAPLCLAACDPKAPSPCAAGFVCQTLPAGSIATVARWTSACLPLGLATDLGGSCRNADDVLSDAACATGSCADLGALGVCSAVCSDASPCPAEASCTPVSGGTIGGTRLCLRRCQGDADCARDPLLACIAQPAPDDASPPISVCAARPCASDATCEPSGHCGGNGICVRGPR
jgi:hypothetical protein